MKFILCIIVILNKLIYVIFSYEVGYNSFKDDNVMLMLDL